MSLFSTKNNDGASSKAESAIDRLTELEAQRDG